MGDLVLDAGSDKRSMRVEKGKSLSLHVGTHQGSLSVIVFKERNTGSGNGNDLLRGSIDEIDLVTICRNVFAVATSGELLIEDFALRTDMDVCLGDDMVSLAIGRKPTDVFGIVVDKMLLYRTIGSFDETVLIDLGIAGKVADKTDVLAFRRLDRANPAVVGRVDIADGRRSAVTSQAATSQGRKPSLVREFGKRVGLIHELGKGIGIEERIDGRSKSLDVDQGRDGELGKIRGRHPVMDGSLHLGKTGTEQGHP